MDHVDRRSDVREVERLLDRRIPAPDHRHRPVLEEEAVAGRAGRYAGAPVPLLRGQAEILRRGAGGDDERIAGVDVLVPDETEGALVEMGAVDVVEDRLRAESPGMGLHASHEIRPLQSLDVARPVVDVRGGGHLPAHLEAGHHDRGEVRAGRVQGGRAPGRTRTEYEEPAVPQGGIGHVEGHADAGCEGGPAAGASPSDILYRAASRAGAPEPPGRRAERREGAARIGRRGRLGSLPSQCNARGMEDLKSSFD